MDEVNLPEGFQTLTFGMCFNQSHGEREITKQTSKFDFWKLFQSETTNEKFEGRSEEGFIFFFWGGLGIFDINLCMAYPHTYYKCPFPPDCL